MIQPVTLTYGSDPELFLKRGDQIIGSERVIPIEGIRADPTQGTYYPFPNKIVQDGVQVELNPGSHHNINAHGEQISTALTTLSRYLRTQDASVCFDGVVKVTLDELNALSDKSRMFLCAPSRNAYGLKPRKVNPVKYLKRSAGGHLHFGFDYCTQLYNKTSVDERQRLIPPFDIFVGNMGVLLDRNPLQAQRRKTYGMAGEFRLPPYGVEYRTLSNFWLRSYTLLSAVTGAANFAASVVLHSISKADIEQELIQVVDIDRVIQAIQTNDWDLAFQNFQSIKWFIGKYTGNQSLFGLNATNLENFERFVVGVKEKGLETYFPEDPIKAWVEGPKVEFSAFLKGI